MIKNTHNSVILNDNLILFILSFIRSFPTCTKNVDLFNNKEEHIQKKKIHDIYCNLSNSCKLFYYLKFKDSYIIFNEEYSKKYFESKEFREEVSKKIDVSNLLIYASYTKKIEYFWDISINYRYIGLLDFECRELTRFKKFSKYKEVLNFITPNSENTEIKEVSMSDLLRKFNSFYRRERENPNFRIEGDFRSFRPISELRILFDFIKKQMIISGDLKNPEDFPEHFKLIEVLKYLKYCFYEI